MRCESVDGEAVRGEYSTRPLARGDPRRLFGEDRGSVTAEFAVVLPAVLMVLALVIGSILLATQRLSLTAAAAEVARLEARGERESAAQRLGQLGSEVRAERQSSGLLHCVTLRASPAGGALAMLEVSASGCAAVSDAGPGS